MKITIDGKEYEGVEIKGLQKGSPSIFYDKDTEKHYQIKPTNPTHTALMEEFEELAKETQVLKTPYDTYMLNDMVGYTEFKHKVSELIKKALND